MTFTPSTSRARVQTRLADLLGTARIVPVVTLERVEDAVPLARALLAGGIGTLEITLRTPAAAGAAAAIAANVPEAVLGIGTVLNRSDLVRARELGAAFALSPGATPELLDAAAADELPFVPGICTASELMAALARGFDIVKFFPAVPAGGMAAVRAFAGPFPQARFCPTGGIGEPDAAAWLALSNVVAVGGSWLTPASDIRNGDWAAITARARRTVAQLDAEYMP
ncbi:MAG: bifunctional 4-hydroxy-2-oxoglutarate aldolase/2-dehydro-3-deoxy-phosphogluconate aldolase [Hyphomicrobiaceae bacterium]